MSPWATHLGSVLSFSGASLLNRLDNRSRYVLGELHGRVPSLIGGDESTIRDLTLVDNAANVAAFVPTTEKGGDLLGEAWTQRDFDETADWLHGQAGSGFETTPATFTPLIQLDVQNQMYEHNSSIYLRLPFTVEERPGLVQLALDMQFDDGFVAYLNGVKVGSVNAPNDPAWNSVATSIRSNADAVKPIRIDLTDYRDLLVPGQNLLSIQGLNRTVNGTDALYLPKWIARHVDEAEVPVVTTDKTQTVITGSGWVNVKNIQPAGAPVP